MFGVMMAEDRLSKQKRVDEIIEALEVFPGKCREKCMRYPGLMPTGSNQQLLMPKITNLKKI